MNLLDSERYKFGICNVEENYNFYFKWLLSKLYKLFIVEGLPDTIEESFMWDNLYLTGKVCFTEMKGKLYALNGNTGGKPNQYYEPTQFLISNPVLGQKEVKINTDNDDGVVVYLTQTDKEYMYLSGLGGLYQLLKQTATLLADNIVSISCAQINSRINVIVTADSPEQRISAEMYVKRLYEGKPWTVLTNDLIDKIGVNPVSSSGTTNTIQQLIELQQYIIASFYNNIGIKSNPINKKERLITDEINVVDDFLAISLDTMFNSLQIGFEQVNKMFGTNITVKLNPILESDNDEDDDISEDGNSNIDDNNSTIDDNNTIDDNRKDDD